MYWAATSFIFRKVDTFIHRRDPRVKLLFALELFVLSLLSASPIEIAVALGAIFSLASIARIITRMYRMLTFSAAFSVMIFVINYLVGYTFVESLILALRFIAIVGSTSIFFLTTSPDELEQVLKWLHLPQDIVFAFVTAVRFVPVLLIDAIQIMDAQKSRGLELERGNFVKRLRKFAPILIPLVVSAVVRSGELAEAMEARAYGAAKKPSSLYFLRLNHTDMSVIALSLIFFSVALAIYLILT